jgi:hypothetical protein
MDLRTLRSAIHRGDAETVVSVVASAPWDGRLQLVGDALVMAVERRQPGAEGLASRCAEAGRQRGWDGDEELAADLDRALARGEDVPLKPLPVDLELLSDVLEQGLGEDPGRLDITTGEVWPASAIEYALDASTDEAARLEEPHRWLTVDPEGSDEAYRDMVLFVTTMSEADPAAVLGRALEGKGAFRRFRNQLGRDPDLEQRWYVLSDERRRGRARAWLAEHGYRPTSPPRV